MNKRGYDPVPEKAASAEARGLIAPLSESRQCEIGSEAGERCPLPARWEVNGVAMCDEDIRMMASMNSDNEERERGYAMRKRKPLEEKIQTPQTNARQARQPQPVVLDQLLTVTEAAAKLGIGRTKLYDLINTNQLPYVEIPGAGESTKRISALTLNAWIKERETVKHAS